MNFKKLLSLAICASLAIAALTGCSKAASSKPSPEAQVDATAQATPEGEGDVTERTVVNYEIDANAAQIIEDITTIQAFIDEAVAEADITAIINAGINAPSAMNGQPWHFSVVTDKSMLEQISDDMGMGGGTPPSGDRPEGAPEGFDGKMPGGDMPEGFDPANMPSGEKPDMGSDAPDGFDGKMPGGDMPEGFDPANIPSTGEDGDRPAAPASSGGAKAGIADAPLVIIVSCKEGSELDAGLATQNMSAEAQLLGYGSKIISSPKMALNGSNQAEYKTSLGIPEDMSAVCMLLIGHTDSEQYDAVSSATTRNEEADVVTYIK